MLETIAVIAVLLTGLWLGASFSETIKKILPWVFIK